MPIYQPDRVEYSIVNGRVSIVADDGTQLDGLRPCAEDEEDLFHEERSV